jgi:molybdopterin synthase catalytic subunit
MLVPVTIRLQTGDFDLAAETASVTRGRTDIGAVVTFLGICRSGEGDAAISALTLEHYPGMAEEEIARQANEALARWPLTALTVIHRHGRLKPGENIMMVLTASAHRAAAFEAAEFLMDYLKTAAPFWKSEERPSGKAWVEAKREDDVAAARWTKS